MRRSILVPELLGEPAGATVTVVMSDDEAGAAEASKRLHAESIGNAYILEGGVNNWIRTFGADEPDIQPRVVGPGSDPCAYAFPAALGTRYEAAQPSPHEWDLE